MTTVPRLSATTPATTVPTNIAALSTTQVAALSVTQVRALSADNLHALASTQIASLSTAALNALTTTQVTQLATTQVAALTATQVRSLGSTTISAFSVDDVRALNATQIGALNATNIKGLSGTDVAALTTAQIGAITATSLGALGSAIVNALGTTQIAAITTTQVRGLTALQINSLGNDNRRALNVSGLTAGQISGLTNSAAANLSNTQLASWTATQVAALSTTASSALTSTQVASLTSAQLGAMKSTTIGDAGGLQINLIWGASTSKAPAAFRSAVMAAAKSFTDTFSNAATINIQVGFGEVNGSRIDSSAVAQSGSRMAAVSYSQLKASLLNNASNSDIHATADASLSDTDPTHGGQFLASTAEQKALGLMSANSASIDGFIGLSSALPMDYAQSGASGKYDAVGALQHEISEVLGRTGSVGRAFGANTYTALDLFRYKAGSGSAPATRSLTAGTTGDYFSIDGGATKLGTFNATTGRDDYADWSMQEAGDAYGFGIAGRKSTTPARDIIEMAAIGYRLTASGLAAAKGTTSNTVA